VTQSKLVKNFKYIPRDKKDTAILVPGWASDYRLFEKLDINFNYLVPCKLSPSSFEKDLLEVVQELKIEKFSLFGCSMGGFLSAEFAAKYPKLIDELTLVSIREEYKKEELKQVKGLLRKSVKGFLKEFYKECFASDEEFAYFKNNLLKTYCEQFELEYLLEGLEYLGRAKIDTNSLQKINKITIIHGRKDKVAPIKEAININNELKNSKIIIFENQGHIPFFSKDFNGKYSK